MKLNRTMWGANPVRSSLRPAALLSMLLWAMLWGGYDTGINLILSPGFPASNLELVHGLRALLPLVAAWLGLLLALPKGGFKPRTIAGPLGLLGLFACTGMLSSGLFSVDPLRALYWAAMYGSVIVVAMAVASNADAASCVAHVMTLNWLIAIGILVGLLLAIPSFGGAALLPTHGSPFGVMAYSGDVAAHGELLGMASTRSTGLGRYAAVAGLVALAKLCQNRKWKPVWLSVLLVALFALVLSQARTETLGFIAGGLVILALRKRRRVMLFGVGALFALLLGLTGFFHDLWTFGTRGQGFDPTLTGRTLVWEQGLEVVRNSPWVGLGFQADRYYMNGQHAHDAVLHALMQAGALGTIAYVAAYGLTWVLVVRLYRSRQSGNLPDEIPGILAFFTIMSITESTAYYSANWLFIAPVLAYIQVMAWPRKAVRLHLPSPTLSTDPVEYPGLALRLSPAGKDRPR
jgi:exopolysaccharide production protein ExoQ